MKRATLQKPVLDTAQALRFATGQAQDSSARAGRTKRGKAAQKGSEALSGQVPSGDVRLVANMREELHLKLKIAAANRRTTIGEILEELVAKHL